LAGFPSRSLPVAGPRPPGPGGGGRGRAGHRGAAEGRGRVA